MRVEPTSGGRQARAGAQPRLPVVVCLLVVGGSVSWRQGVYFAGGLDPVVLTKAALAALAVVLCLHAWLGCQDRQRIGGRSSVFLLLYVTVATFGAFAAEDLVPSAILAVRVLMLATAAVLLLVSYRVDIVLRSLLWAMAIVGLLAVGTGLVLGSGGRLGGGIPPLAPNEIALLCGVPALGVIWRNLVHAGGRFDLLGLALLLGAVWLSESRTGLAALIVAVLLMLGQARSLRPAVMAAVVAAGGAAVAVLLTTDLLSGYFGRSDEGSVTTLNSRTIAWTAALELPQTPYAWFMGGGLALKRIPVQGQYWNEQGLDSSWVSAWVQGGLICVVILLLWIVSAFVASLRSPRPYRMLFSGVLLFQLIRSFLESGLIDATPSFFLFMVVSTLAEAGSRRALILGTPTRSAEGERAPEPTSAGG